MVSLPEGAQPFARSSNTVYRSADGATVVKVFRRPTRGEAHREWTGLQLLERELPDRAPAPLRLDDTVADAPVVVMTAIPGDPLGGAPSDAAVAGLVEAYAELHRLDSSCHGGLPEVVGAPTGVVERIRRRRALATDGDLEGPPPVADAWAAAEAWLATADATEVATIAEPAFGRGDANLANHLWDGERVRLVDLEDSGRTDVAFQLAELAEHLSNHELPDRLWEDLRAALDLDPSTVRRWLQARRALAIFWLGQLVTNPRARERNRPDRTEEQARRVLTLLG